jgi:hypothetical protein
VTYVFSPGGTVTGSPNMAFQIFITGEQNVTGGSNTITVSGVGNVSVSSP